VQSGEPANITPPAGFFDMNGGIVQPNNNSISSNHVDMPPKLAALDPSWTYNATSSTFSNSNPYPAGAIKVLPSDLKTTSSGIPSSDFKRRNGSYLNGVVEEATVRRGGLSTHILSHPLTEGIEQNYNRGESNDAPIRAWTDALSS